MDLTAIASYKTKNILFNWPPYTRDVKKQMNERIFSVPDVCWLRSREKGLLSDFDCEGAAFVKKTLAGLINKD